MGGKLSISVAIPTYNRGKYLIQTINEVIRQQHPAVREIIVIDQSLSKSYDKKQWRQIQEWIKSGKIVYQQLSIINANAARNRCLSLAKGNIILFLDDDVLLPPGFIDLHYHSFLKPYHGKTVVAIGGKSYHRKDKQDEAIIDNINWNNYTQYTTGDFLHYPNDSSEPLKAEETLIGCNMSVVKEFAIAIGGFDEYFGSYYDEADFCFRLRKEVGEKGVLLVNTAACLLHLRAIRGGHRKTAIDLNDELYRQLSFNLFFIRHYPFWRRIPKLLINVRVGPLMKKNFLNFNRFWMSLYCYFKSIQLGFQLKNKIKSPFIDNKVE